MIRLLQFITLCLALLLPLSAIGKVLGAKPSLKSSTPIADLLASPDRYVGKVVQVSGRITEVCQMAGCWVIIVDDATSKSVRIKVNDGEIVFPKESSGKQATAEGVFTKIEMTKAQAIARAKHEAEELGRQFDPTKVPESSVVYQIKGTGAVVDGI